jgi:hypothetical protein
MTEDKVVIECECGTHLLQVTNWIEETNPKFQSFYLAMFNYGKYSRSFKERLKMAWSILRKGDPYDDQLTLEPSEAKKLADFINSNLPQP